ncbi:uncharacterized protein LY89DRAFT_787664 [Mollisia scopiformis]|uniref:Protection of telomeres protein 1 n=1 Tax=Mollisia scopiformis TaxID=149040 RepID=A0A132BC85_MOLSC|nr:uncharacterized protein LY89DRAFT_787664 [Mollisia scopiformis]KUJ09981.1 hypothetical protein LY89DRAFT_787664 [Mollisia scopiformis]
MTSTPDSSALPLPPDFKSIEEINNMPSETIKAGAMVNVIGFIKDFQPPVQTRGSDYKCTLEILDQSTQFEMHGLKIIIFWPLKSMPAVLAARDIVLLRKAKLQMWSGSVSLMANKASEFHFLSCKNPILPGGAMGPPWTSYRYDSGKGKIPNDIETRYVIEANHHSNEMDLPSDHEFERKTKEAMRSRDKFSLLKDVEPERFYNILGQVIKVYGSGDRVTLYLSDYTANSKFYNYAWGEDANAAVREGDEYGYTKTKSKESKAWPGPFGKMTIQLTLYDAHAAFVQDEIEVNQWVLLSNVQIKFGNIGGLLEGFLRGDTHRFEGKIQVKVMEQAEDPDQNDTRWKEAVRRRVEWWKKFEKQKQNILDEASGAGLKRKNEEELSKGNSKKRRKEMRELAKKKAAEADAKSATRLDLNDNIRSTFPDQPILPLKQILEPLPLLKEEKSDGVLSPFTVCKYKANVRVVDYFPNRLEDFAVGRRPSDMDILSDYSGGEDTDLEEDMRTFRSGKGFAEKKWEWRFSLQVEDVDSKDSQGRLWLMVSNHDAQCLLNLDDNAANLRRNPELLASLKEQMFKLWGDLEERKSSTLPNLSAKGKEDPPASSFDSSVSSPAHKAGGQPDLDSDDEMGNTGRLKSKKSASGVLQERDPNVPMTVNGIGAGSKADANLTPKNKAFTCCIKQYGVKVDEEDPAKANAGPGERWQRVFGMFGTQIM